MTEINWNEDETSPANPNEGGPVTAGEPGREAPDTGHGVTDPTTILWDKDDTTSPSAGAGAGSSGSGDAGAPGEVDTSRSNDTRRAASRRRLSPSFVLSVASATTLVLAVGGLGFVFGHYVDKPAPVIKRVSASSGLSGGFGGYPSSGFGGYPSSGFGEFPSSGFGGYPSLGSGTSTTANRAAAKIAASVDTGLVDINTNLSYEDATGAATGMILTSGGLVLTNNHVIEGATSITARDVATGTTYQATVVGYDTSADVALLQLKDASGLTTVTLGTSSSVKVGEEVVGIGNAGGAGGTPSFATGNVIALDQSISASDDGSPTGAEKLTGMIESNADIQAGDSGGPLVNKRGDVIAMDTAGASSNGGFGFTSTGTAVRAYSIPIATAMAIVKSIENGDGTSAIHVGATAFMGVQVSEASGTSNGVEIVGIVAGTPAAQSALAVGDVITTIDGQSITSTSSLSEELQSLAAGDSVSVGYTTPEGTTATLTLTLASGPAQ